MLQTLNIPSSPLPEVPVAQPSAPGDGGERAEFAQLLQQARAIEPDERVPDEPTVLSAKHARPAVRERPFTPRGALEQKVNNTQHADGESADAEAGVAGCIKHVPLTDALPAAIDAAAESQAAEQTDTTTPAAALDAAALPLHLRPHDPLPDADTAQTPPTASDEHATGARVGARIGARDQRLPTRIEAGTSAPADGSAAHTPATDPAWLNAKDAAFSALHPDGTGRSTSAPLFDRVPLDATPGSAQAVLARELQQALSTHADAAEATLRATPDEAGFAPAFGAQVALWVKDGVQEARLQLHPAELGPVSVQIALDGQAAHIDFSAAVAATRDSIERSLPALAAALRDAGFTLAGGGVFGGSGQGSQGSSRERTPHGRSMAGGVTGAAQTAAAVPRRWARSLLDVYA